MIFFFIAYPINSKFTFHIFFFFFLSHRKCTLSWLHRALSQYNTQPRQFRENCKVCVYVTVIMRTTLRRNGALISHRRSKKTTTTRISGSREAYSRYVNACNSLSSEGLLSRYERRKIEPTTTGIYNRLDERK